MSACTCSRSPFQLGGLCTSCMEDLALYAATISPGADSILRPDLRPVNPGGVPEEKSKTLGLLFS